MRTTVPTSLTVIIRGNRLRLRAGSSDAVGLATAWGLYNWKRRKNQPRTVQGVLNAAWEATKISKATQPRGN